MSARSLGDERVHQNGEAGWAAANGIVYGGLASLHEVRSIEADDHPISGDDLALAKAGVIS